jgi:hypothetical protein
MTHEQTGGMWRGKADATRLYCLGDRNLSIMEEDHERTDKQDSRITDLAPRSDSNRRAVTVPQVSRSLYGKRTKKMLRVDHHAGDSSRERRTVLRVPSRGRTF